MKYKKAANGMEIPHLGFGTWEIGGRHEADYSEDEAALKALDSALQLGYTHFDTAEMYGKGHAEEILGEAIRSAGKARKDLLLTSKVLPENLGFDHVMRACEQSLKRLQTDYLDMYLVHEYNPQIPLKETFRALNRLVDEKVIRAFGVSNFAVEHLKEAFNHIHHPIVQNQIEYSLWVRNEGMINKNMETEIIPFCRENGILINAWRPLKKGELQSTELIDRLCVKYKCTLPDLALAWLLQKEGMITIVKSLNEKHIRENLNAMTLTLEKEDIAVLDALYA